MPHAALEEDVVLGHLRLTPESKDVETLSV
jgi:hypothetical protein